MKIKSGGVGVPHTEFLEARVESLRPEAESLEGRTDRGVDF